MSESGWTLPETVNPDRVCLKLEIPNDFFHLAAFWGAMLSLSYWFNWARDTHGTGKAAADVWFDVFMKAQTAFIVGCHDNPLIPDDGTTLEDLMSSQIRISPDNACIIQMWCIDHWEDWYNPTDCVVGGVAQGGPEPPPAPGEAKEKCILINGNSRYLLPWTVDGGDIITTSGASGGWADGTGFWSCPNGSSYVLGTCGSPNGTSGADPLPSVDHMRVIGHLITDDVYFDAFNTAFHVPTSSATQDVEFLCNDVSLTDNQGSINICIKTEHSSGVINMISSTTNIINNRAILSKSQVRIGDTFTFELVAQTAPGSNPFDGIFTMDTQATLVITAVANWTPGTGWQWFDPPTVSAGAPAVSDTQSTTGFAGNATTPGIVTFQVVSIP